MTKKSKQKFKYFENEKSVRDEIKSTFRHFKGLSVVKNGLKLESPSLIIGGLHVFLQENHFLTEPQFS